MSAASQEEGRQASELTAAQLAQIDRDVEYFERAVERKQVDAGDLALLLAKVVRPLLAGRTALAADRDELQGTFDLQRRRETPWIERWRREDPARANTLPDYGELLRWILDKADVAEARWAARERLMRAVREAGHDGKGFDAVCVALADVEAAEAGTPFAIIPKDEPGPSWSWRCDRCFAEGVTSIREGTDVMTAAQIILTEHTARRGTQGDGQPCKGGVHSIRVTKASAAP